MKVKTNADKSMEITGDPNRVYETPLQGTCCFHTWKKPEVIELLVEDTEKWPKHGPGSDGFGMGS